MPAERIALESLVGQKADVNALRSVAERVQAGAVFLYPTETIYGLGGIATPAVRARILQAKRRPPENPLILLAGKRDHLDRLGLVFSPQAECLAKAFWPGNLTLVLPAAAGNELLGVRVTNHPFVQALGKAIREPVYSTSANISGDPYVDEPDRIYDTFRNEVDFMVDGGTLPASLPSSVVMVTREGRVEITREGAVAAFEIDAALENGGHGGVAP